MNPIKNNENKISIALSILSGRKKRSDLTQHQESLLECPKKYDLVLWCEELIHKQIKGNWELIAKLAELNTNIAYKIRSLESRIDDLEKEMYE